MADTDPDGIHRAEWQALFDAVVLSALPDKRAFQAWATRVDGAVNQRRLRLYLVVTVRAAIIMHLGRLPTREDVVAISEQLSGRWVETVDYDQGLLLGVLLTARDLASAEELVPGSRGALGMVVVLGALVRDFDLSLTEIRSALASYWRTHEEFLTEHQVF